MNNVFSFKRFGRLLVKHTAEHFKSYLMALTVLIGVMVLGGSFIIFLIPDSIDIGFQSALFMIILLLAGTIFTSTIFADIGDKKKAMAALTLPATHFEKYLVAWLYSFLVFLLVFTGSFYLIMAFLLSLKHTADGHNQQIFNVFNNHFGSLILLAFAVLHAVAFYGAIVFDKLHFIKTAFAFFIFIAFLIVINKIFQGALTGRDVIQNSPFGNLRFMEGNKYIAVSLKETQGGYVLYIAMLMAILFWIAAYFRLKEKQV